MYINSFIIKETEGNNYANLSGDHNLIHRSDLIGHNSIYGHKITHGVLIILKFIEIINLKKFFKIKTKFFNGFKYNTKIKVLKKKIIVIKIYVYIIL